MRMWKLTLALLAFGIFCLPAFGEDQPRPGTVNYVDGTAFVEGRPLVQNDAGQLALEPGQILSTTTGKVEVLLTPAAYLRVGDHSAIQMISPEMTPTQIKIERGKAGIEVDALLPQQDLEVVDGGLSVRLTRPGYYEFDAEHPLLRVFSGQAEVMTSDGAKITVKGHHQVALAEGARLKPASFDRNKAQDSLTRWSQLRSRAMAGYAYPYGPGWYGGPWMYGYYGVPYGGPFGWGYYPPVWGGYWGGWYGGGFYRRGWRR